MPFWMGRWTGATGRGAYTATLYRGERPGEIYYERAGSRSIVTVEEERANYTYLPLDPV